VTIVADHVLETADAALSGLIREQEVEKRALPAPFDERVLDQEPPRSDHERWLRERAVCSFCREDYKPTEPLWVRVQVPGRFAGRIICATCISAIGFTGCEWYVHSRAFASHVINVFGTHTPPDDWEYLPPGWRDVADALEHGPEVYVPRLRILRTY
jgi:hypothetical protein